MRRSAASYIIDGWSCALSRYAEGHVDEPPSDNYIDLSPVRIPELVARVLKKEGIDSTSKELLSVLSTLMRAPRSRDGKGSDDLLNSLVSECEQRGVGPEARLLVSICSVGEL